MTAWIATAILGAAVGAWLAFQRRAGPFTERVALAVLPPCALVFALAVAERIVAAPFWDWNAVRLASSFALAQGHSLYPSLEAGATLSYIYGPGFAVAFLPATLVGQPTVALLMGMLLQLAYFLVPVLLFHLSPASSRAAATRLGTTTYGLLGFFAFALVAIGNPALRYSGFSLHADAPTFALLLSAFMLLLSTPQPPIRNARLAVIGVLVALAVWCKQPAAPVAIALPLWIGMTEGWRQFVRAVLVMGAVGLTVSIAMLAGFGYQDLVFNMFTLPRAVPWKPSPDGRWALFVDNLQTLARMSAPFVVLASVGAALGIEGRGASPPRSRRRLREQRWLLLLIVGLAMVPTSVLGIVKRGGAVNSLSFTIFFVAVAATVALADAARRRPSRRASTAALLLVVLTVGLAARLVMTDPTATERGWDFARRLGDNPQQQAHDALLAHPGEIYFPWNPLAHLLVEGELYHIEYGVNERRVAGLPMSMTQFREHIPPDIRFLAFQPRRQTEWTQRDYLTEFSARTEVGELPEWIVYTRTDGANITARANGRPPANRRNP